MTAEKGFLQTGEVIEERYEVVREIGQGGMSTVYLVRDVRLRKNWALKAVGKTADEAENDTLRRSILTEAGILKKLTHPRLPRVTGIVETEQCFGILMDYIEGRTLGDLLRTEGAQPEALVIRWAKQLCGVLEYLHSCDPPVIYRDMKPDNIMRKPDGDIALFDFGIAREYKPCRTQDTQSLGTFGYAAPEQFGGSGQTTPETDIYSLGATLYHLVTGVNPADQPCGTRPIREVDPELSPGFEAILLKCMQRDPAKRYGNCAELLFALEHYEWEDAAVRRQAKRKMAAFASPLCAGILGLVLILAGLAGKSAQRKDLYAEKLASCSDAAAESALSGVFRPEILKEYTEAIDIDPGRPEGYTGLLDYCAETGQAEAGLRSVCARIDAGTGHIDRNSEVLMKTANLYFQGDRENGTFSGDYTRAAKYYAEVDAGEFPEAVYLCRISEALSGRTGSGAADWNAVAEALRAFEQYTDSRKEDNGKIEQYRLAAGICISHKAAIAETGCDPCAMAAEMLRKALSALEREELSGVLSAPERAELSGALSAPEREGLSKNGELSGIRSKEKSDLRKALLTDLTACLLSEEPEKCSGSDLEEAREYCEELLGMSLDTEERGAVLLRIAEIAERTENTGKIRNAYEELLAQDPQNTGVRLRYCSWLLKEGRKEEAEQLYREIGETEDISAEQAFSAIGRKLDLTEKMTERG